MSRIIILLVVVLIIGLLANRQLNKPGPEPVVSEQQDSIEVPDVPQRPQDVPQFEQDMNSFMKDAEAERAKKMEQVGQ